MGIFKKKKKPVEESSNPTLNSIQIPQSDLGSLVVDGIQLDPAPAPSSASATATAAIPSSSNQTSLTASEIVNQNVNQSIDSNQRPPPGSYSSKAGRLAITPTSPSSPSLGAVQQFHRPQPIQRERESQRERSTPPSSFNPNLNLKDFRVSPFSKPTLNPAQQRKAHELGRSLSLKKSKIPKNLNLLVAGAKNSGKTSWIRSFLETLELGSAVGIGQGVKEAAGLFGLSPTSFLPIPTSSISTLPSLPISDQALLQALPESLQEDPESLLSQSEDSACKRSSIHGGNYGQPSCRLLLSISDTPGFDFKKEDEFQLERKTSSILRFIEEKLKETFLEEKKVHRKSQGGLNLSNQHIHALVYFIDFENLVEREIQFQVQESKKNENLKLKKEAGEISTSTTTRKGLGSHHSRQNSKSENDLTLSSLLKRSNSESSLSASRNRTISTSKAPPLPTFTPDQSEKKTQLSISLQEMRILKRLSQRANIIPVVACADKLAENQLKTVREAIKRGMKEILGERAMMEIVGSGKVEEEEEEEDDKMRDEKKPIPLRGSRRTRLGSSNGPEASSDTLPNLDIDSALAENETSNGITSENEGVKLIRIRSRRSFSRSGLTDTTFELEPSIRDSSIEVDDRNGIGMKRSGSSTSSLGFTSPLFNSTEDSHILHKLLPTDQKSLEEMYPFSLISPEINEKNSKVSVGLVRARSGSNRSLRNRTFSNGSSIIVEKTSKVGLGLSAALPTSSSEKISAVVNSNDTNLSSKVEGSDNDQIPPIPPIPPIPSQLQQTMKQSSILPNTPPSQDSASPIPHVLHRTPSSSSMLARPRPSIPANLLRGPHPFDPNRFTRSFRWAKIDLLDPTHCEFLQLRALLLKAGLENLHRRTENLYEDFRRERLENRRETREVPEVHEKLIRSLSIL